MHMSIKTKTPSLVNESQIPNQIRHILTDLGNVQIKAEHF